MNAERIEELKEWATDRLELIYQGLIQTPDRPGYWECIYEDEIEPMADLLSLLDEREGLLMKSALDNGSLKMGWETIDKLKAEVERLTVSESFAVGRQKFLEDCLKKAEAALAEVTKPVTVTRSVLVDFAAEVLGSITTSRVVGLTENMLREIGVTVTGKEKP